jgi:hypothetical protein
MFAADEVALVQKRKNFLMATTPTQEQIAQVKTNAHNIKHFVNHLHDYLQDVINEVYGKLSETPDDSGQTFITTVMNGTFGSIGAIDFAGSGVVASFLEAFFGAYAGPNMPPSLQAAFADIWGRFNATFLQANADLAAIWADPAGHWNSTYTDPTTGNTMAVSHLGDGKTNMPGSDYPNYQTMTNNAVAAYRVALTKQTIGISWQVLQATSGEFMAGTVEDLAKWWPTYLKHNPSLYATWYPDEGGTSCRPVKGLQVLENYLGTGTSWQFGSHAPDDMCNWLFKDDQFGGTTNPIGIATRKDVFYNWGLNGSLSAKESLKAATPQPLSPEHEASATEWRELFARQPRKELEAMLIEKAWADPYFMHMLVRSPRETIAKTLGIELPAHAKFEVIRERPGDYKFVIPWVGVPEPKE